MKKLRFYIYSLLLTSLFLIPACNDKDELNTNLTPVRTIFTPEDNAFVKLLPSTNASVVFEWEQARAEDGTLVLYEVAFDKENGDFSKPVYSLTSDNNGVQNKLTLSHKDLNKIANLAGIKSLEQGKMKWTVIASKGVNALPASTPRIIEVERPAGFAEIPADLFITGEATEAGTDLAQAIPLKQVSAGVFEIYTSLKGGSYKLVDRNSGSPKSYYFAEGLIREGEAGTSPTSETKVYRIVLDFNSAVANVAEVVSMGLWISAYNKITNELAYTGTSTWMAENIKIEFFQFDWGRDERYKFRMTLKDANGQTRNEFLGSTNADNPRPDNATPASYYYIVPVNDSQWDFTFKFRTEVDNSNSDVLVKLDPAASYTHEVIVK